MKKEVNKTNQNEEKDTSTSPHMFCKFCFKNHKKTRENENNTEVIYFSKSISLI